MTNNREEQIYKAADKATYQTPPQYSELVHKSRKAMCAYEVGFIDGCVWADQHPQWIPVEEKRPPFDWKDDGTWSTSLPILIYSIHGISIGTFQLDHVIGKSYWLFDGSKHEEFSDGYRLITHWMPLPEAPRKEADND